MVPRAALCAFCGGWVVAPAAVTAAATRVLQLKNRRGLADC